MGSLRGPATVLRSGCTALALGLGLVPGPGWSQQVDQLPYPVSTTLLLTMNQDRLFQESAYGRAALDHAEKATAELATENRRIEQALEEEEQSLTDRRPALPAEEFARLASAFDSKVEEIRAAQDAKSRAISRQLDDDRKRFFDAALPVLAGLLSDKGALAILNESAIILSLSALDVTDDAIARIDAELTYSPADPPPADPALTDPSPTPTPAP